MRVCASLSGPSDMALLGGLDLVEVRLDRFDSVPDIPGRTVIAKFVDGFDESLLPDGFDGIVDIGTDEPERGYRCLSSYHDYESTPNAERICSILNGMKGEIVKGAFRTESFKDLLDVFDAARAMKRRHVLVGMGQMGTITRIRSPMLGNEFTYGSISEPTASGQLDARENAAHSDGCMVLGLVGHPIAKSLSPVMHEAALRAAGIDGCYLRFDCDSIEQIDDFIRAYEVRGVNVTMPYKTEVMDWLDAVDPSASSLGAVNTVVNDGGVLVGYNTDVDGIRTALSECGFEPEDKRALVLGSGGAARACVHTLREDGCDVVITGRNRDTGRELASETDSDFMAPGDVSVRCYDLVVNCTPVGMYADGPYPVNISEIRQNQCVFDMAYGRETPLMREASAKGCRLARGSDMLAAQGARSFELWTGRKGAFEVMRRAIQ